MHIHCGDEGFKVVFEHWLKVRGTGYEKEGICLLVDKPLGWAVLDHPEVDLARCVVLSDNPCPTYQLDLLDREPVALLRFNNWDVLLATLRTLRPESVLYPKVSTPLTPVERKTLRLVALGRTNKEIAHERDVTEGTVKNSLAAIYKKLSLRSRVEASHYYLGNWHLIEGWQVPPFVL